MKSPKFRNKQPANGFALIATISVMVLLVMIALAMLSLSTMETRASRNDQAMAQAKANARMALMMAIGDLQLSLGPDQRVNANAAIGLSQTTRRSQWVGAYQSWPADQATRPEPQLVRWLVSGDPTKLTDPGAAFDGMKIADEMVTLVGEGSLGKSVAPEHYVEVGKVNTYGRQAYAWWVSDESSKARVSESTALAKSAAESRSRLMASPRTGLERLERFQTITRDDTRLNKVNSVSGLDLLGDYSQGKNPYFHDVTTDSAIVMTNVRAGGLRKDLSMFFARPAPAIAAPLPLYSVQGQGYTESQHGITMRELWTYYNLWKEIDYVTAPIDHQDGGTVPSGTPTLVSKTNHRSSVNDIFYPYRRLTMVRASWILSYMSRQEKNPHTGQNEYQLYAVVDPILTFWNPFDVAIKIDVGSYQGYKFWGFPYIADLDSSLGKYSRSVSRMIDPGGSAHLLTLLYGQTEPIVLRPGEVQVVSQGSRDETVYGPNSRTTNIELGWNFGAGFRFPVTNIRGNGATWVQDSYSPDPNAHFDFGLTEFLQYQGKALGANATDSIWTGGLMIDRNNPGSGESKLSATSKEGSKYFPVIPAKSGGRFTLQEVENRKRPAIIYSMDMKMEVDPIGDGGFQGKFRLRHNPKIGGYDIQSFDDSTMATTPLQISVRSINSWKDPFLDVTAQGLGYIGGSYSAEFGNPHVVTHSIPREPIHSIAAFQHALGNGVQREYYDGKEPARNYFLQPSISYAVGNSFAPSFMASSQTEGTLNGGPAADHSYLANQALWDTWFFSSIASQTSHSWQQSGQTRDQRTVYEDFLAGTENGRLPISQYVPWGPNQSTAADDLFDGATPGAVPSALAAEKSAAYLLLKGGFNVNTTSVNAWKLFLSGLRKAQIATSDPAASHEETLTAGDQTVIAGLLTPFGSVITDASLSDPKSPEQWKGYRSLTDDQIDELAEAIVRQVKSRGPFLSLADFINRRLETSGTTHLAGTIQAALDDDAVSINQPFRSNGRAITKDEATAAGVVNPEAEAGPAAAGIPGYVKQGDILTTVGPYLTARSDTFKIRSYGETRAADGRVIARVWCEAIVQRVPAYLDSRDQPETKPEALTQDVNKVFGRRIEVISLRWLGPNEI